MASTVVCAFYKFVAMANLEELKANLLDLCAQHEIRGTILLAQEGINSTVSGSAEAIDSLMAFLRSQPGLGDLGAKTSYADGKPFARLKVKIKKEIVTLRAPEADPTQQVGTYVPPAEWNALISDPDVVVVDTRNDYEVEVGTFKGAIDPKTTKFGEFPAWVDQNLDPTAGKKVAMFCTGGIRCEKATALLLAKGFQDVYHLDGGILKYLETVPPEESLFQGECFIFDEREQLAHGLRPKVEAGFREIEPRLPRGSAKQHRKS